MKTTCALLALLFLQGTIAGVVRKPPAFATPIFSDSYLPAAMQVIFHAVEQLKSLQAEEASQNSSAQRTNASVSASTIATTVEQTSEATTSNALGASATTALPIHPHEDVSVPENTSIEERETTKAPDVTQKLAAHGPAKETDATTMANLTDRREHHQEQHQETPEVNEETPEVNYATPEANYETPEAVHGTRETNHELPEEDEEIESGASSTSNYSPEVSRVQHEDGTSTTCGTSSSAASSPETSDSGKKKKEPTIDSVVEEIYEILKPTPSVILEDDVGDNGESKSSSGVSAEKMEVLEDEDDETRFTLLGEKVAQVPRPSLTNYLKRAKVPLSASLEQLAALYDSLSKDARKQGFGKYAGYSDEVLKTLESSAEGGVGPQLKILLTRILDRGELTRDDAKSNATAAVRDLNDTSTSLSKDCKRVLPLRYAS